MRAFELLTQQEQEKVNAKYILPEDKSGIEVNEHLVPMKAFRYAKPIGNLTGGYTTFPLRKEALHDGGFHLRH